ncbi:MAG: hypothetical protein QME14_05350 [Methanobacteriaceae archaeon]|nr:hypothetical protein [Methanobacteriaceae archaeon]
MHRKKTMKKRQLNKKMDFKLSYASSYSFIIGFKPLLSLNKESAMLIPLFSTILVHHYDSIRYSQKNNGPPPKKTYNKEKDDTI